VLVALRFGIEALEWRLGGWGIVLGLVVVGVLVLSWRVAVHLRARRHDGSEYTPAMVARQIERSGVSGPAFAEDGSVLGTSVFAVNQRSKVIEVVGEYELFDSAGASIGRVVQIGQGRFKRLVRFVLPVDQFFTHHFDVVGRDDRVVLRITRPAKFLRSRVEVFDGHDRFLGRIVQQNVFGKINFGLYTSDGHDLGRLRAENWRAWDFHIETADGQEVATITKSWEGMARTVLSTADTYVVRVHRRLDDPLRALVYAAALTVDLALKQDARGLGA
jgi:hypothetical protein